MMEIKFVEIRDTGTCIPAMAVRLVPSDPVSAAYIDRTGYSLSNPSVLLCKLQTGESHIDWDDWGNGGRSVGLCHQYIALTWSKITSGQVVDWRVIANEMDASRTPEREIFTKPLPSSARRNHTFGPTQVGHGYLQCTNCRMTAAEATVLGPYCLG